ncbi:MAG: (2Fe-2S)-binding protein [Ramlibacter sp.]|nr:(2Fe-2S)-binding protein [Ramlibacter sp.]
MPVVHLIQPDGAEVRLQAAEGKSLMETAVGAGVQGIVGECGGSAMCATCHVYVEEPWLARLPAPLETELEMLECTASERRPNSRLSCQIKLSAGLDGITVRLPESQQ